MNSPCVTVLDCNIYKNYLRTQSLKVFEGDKVRWRYVFFFNFLIKWAVQRDAYNRRGFWKNKKYVYLQSNNQTNFWSITVGSCQCLNCKIKSKILKEEEQYRYTVLPILWLCNCIILYIIHALKKIYPTHVIKLGFAPKTYPPWQYKYCKW